MLEEKKKNEESIKYEYTLDTKSHNNIDIEKIKYNDSEQ